MLHLLQRTQRKSPPKLPSKNAPATLRERNAAKRAAAAEAVSSADSNQEVAAETQLPPKKAPASSTPPADGESVDSAQSADGEPMANTRRVAVGESSSGDNF